MGRCEDSPDEIYNRQLCIVSSLRLLWDLGGDDAGTQEDSAQIGKQRTFRTKGQRREVPTTSYWSQESMLFHRGGECFQGECGSR